MNDKPTDTDIEIKKFNLLRDELSSHLSICGNTSDSTISFLLMHIVKLQMRVDELENKKCTCSHTTVYGSGSGVCK